MAHTHSWRTCLILPFPLPLILIIEPWSLTLWQIIIWQNLMCVWNVVLLFSVSRVCKYVMSSKCHQSRITICWMFPCAGNYSKYFVSIFLFNPRLVLLFSLFCKWGEYLSNSSRVTWLVSSRAHGSRPAFITTLTLSGYIALTLKNKLSI